jgi:hypothetical protein
MLSPDFGDSGVLPVPEDGLLPVLEVPVLDWPKPVPGFVSLATPELVPLDGVEVLGCVADGTGASSASCREGPFAGGTARTGATPLL